MNKCVLQPQKGFLEKGKTSIKLRKQYGGGQSFIIFSFGALG